MTRGELKELLRELMYEGAEPFRQRCKEIQAQILDAFDARHVRTTINGKGEPLMDENERRWVWESQFYCLRSRRAYRTAAKRIRSRAERRASRVVP